MREPLQTSTSLCRASSSRRSFTFLEFVKLESFDLKMCSNAGLGEMAIYLVHRPGLVLYVGTCSSFSLQPPTSGPPRTSFQVNPICLKIFNACVKPHHSPQTDRWLGSGPRYVICVTLFCALRESKNLRPSSIACDSCMAVGFLESRSILAWPTKSDTSGHCLPAMGIKASNWLHVLHYVHSS